MSHTKMIDDTTDLCHDLEEGTFYFQKYLGEKGDTAESQTFNTEEDAMEALKSGKLEWE